MGGMGCEEDGALGARDDDLSKGEDADSKEWATGTTVGGRLDWRGRCGVGSGVGIAAGGTALVAALVRPLLALPLPLAFSRSHGLSMM